MDFATISNSLDHSIILLILSLELQADMITFFMHEGSGEILWAEPQSWTMKRITSLCLFVETAMWCSALRNIQIELWWTKLWGDCDKTLHKEIRRKVCEKAIIGPDSLPLFTVKQNSAPGNPFVPYRKQRTPFINHQASHYLQHPLSLQHLQNLLSLQYIFFFN